MVLFLLFKEVNNTSGRESASWDFFSSKKEPPWGSSSSFVFFINRINLSQLSSL